MVRLETERLSIFPITPAQHRLWVEDLPELERELGRPYRGVPLAGSDLEDARRQLGEAEKNPARYPYHTAWFLVEKKLGLGGGDPVQHGQAPPGPGLHDRGGGGHLLLGPGPARGGAHHGGNRLYDGPGLPADSGAAGLPKVPGGGDGLVASVAPKGRPPAAGWQSASADAVKSLWPDKTGCVPGAFEQVPRACSGAPFSAGGTGFPGLRPSSPTGFLPLGACHPTTGQL